MAFGALVAVAGMSLIVFKEPAKGEDPVSWRGLQLTLSTPYLVVYLSGVLVFIAPPLLGEELSRLIREPVPVGKPPGESSLA